MFRLLPGSLSSSMNIGSSAMSLLSLASNCRTRVNNQMDVELYVQCTSLLFLNKTKRATTLNLPIQIQVYTYILA